MVLAYLAVVVAAAAAAKKWGTVEHGVQEAKHGHRKKGAGRKAATHQVRLPAPYVRGWENRRLGILADCEQSISDGPESAGLRALRRKTNLQAASNHQRRVAAVFPGLGAGTPNARVHFLPFCLLL